MKEKFQVVSIPSSTVLFYFETVAPKFAQIKVGQMMELVALISYVKLCLSKGLDTS